MTQPENQAKNGKSTLVPEATPLVLFGLWLVITTGWWGGAFLQLPAAAPAWLARAQAVCFGLAPSGLPETYGWWQLVLAPGSLMVALWAVWGQPLRVALRVTAQRWPGRIVLGLISALVLAEGVWIGGRIVEGLESTRPATYPTMEGALPEDYPRRQITAPSIALTQADGSPFSLHSLRGTPVVLTFAYGLCDTICPVMVDRAYQGVKQAQGLRAQLIVVTLDPWRDRVSALPDIAKRWKLTGEATLLSGAVKEVEAVLNAYRVPRERDVLNGEIAHPPLVFVIDGEGRLAYTLSNPSPSWIAEALRRVSRS